MTRLKLFYGIHNSFSNCLTPARWPGAPISKEMAAKIVQEMLRRAMAVVNCHF